MIVLRSWLDEFVDLEGVSSKEICDTLNSIGLEVDSIESIKIPKGVVVGKVLECKKHPDADKLNICQVDLGEKVEQIVCGTKNVAKDQFVAVATVGCDLGEGFIIKEAELRGVASNGMICSSSEIGLPKTNDGILVLDDSIGELELGRELDRYHLLNDDIIEIELTANRGDALSIHGIARDLSAALQKELKESPQIAIEKDISISVDETLPTELSYMQFSEEIKRTALIDLRVASIGRYEESALKNLLNYTTHATGVLFRSYPKRADKIEIKEVDGVGVVYLDDEMAGVVGVNQNIEGVGEDNLIEASYIDPHFISKAMMGRDIKKDELYYNSSRGSENSLDLGYIYLAKLLGKDSLRVNSTKTLEDYQKVVALDLKWLGRFIGVETEKSRVVSILKKLGFLLEESGEELKVRVPLFRSDIQNRADLAEEIVRMVGIDKIASKPLTIVQRAVTNSSYFEYKKRNFYRVRATGAGFSEAIHYFFDSSKLQQELGFEGVKESLDLINPINSDLDTLRVTLLLHHIRSASLNIKNSKKAVKLFEIGRVVDRSRVEKKRVAFIHSGEREGAYIVNSAKAKSVDLLSFAKSVSDVIGDFELKRMDEPSKLLSPYENADIIQNGEKIGFLGALHIDIRERFDLPKSYVCEIDFDSLDFELVTAKPYSKFPSLNRDISLLKPKDMSFDTIKKSIDTLSIDEIVKFYPIDLYKSEELKDKESLTLRFVIQSDEKTLNEDEINAIIGRVLEHLNSELGLELR